MRRIRARAPIHVHYIILYSLVRARARARVHTRGEYARVLSEPANKLVCGGLPHWESFVINLLSGNAHYIRAVARKSKRSEFT